MKKFDVIIVGGGPAGFNAAKTIRTLYPERRILLINDKENFQIPCSIPYIVSGRIPAEKNVYPLSKVKNLGVELLISKVTSINPSESQVFLENGSSYRYERLILATGWIPNTLMVENSHLDGIYYITTETGYVQKLVDEVKSAKRIVLIGAGFISLGFADQISKGYPDKEITIIEASDHIASGIFSESFEREIEKELKSQNVRIVKDTRVVGFEGNGRVRKVVFEDGEKMEADLVFVFIGFKPNSRLAVDAGLSISERGEIIVDGFLRTSEDNILAAGNCVLHRSAIDGEPVPGMFASISARDGRIAGLNVAGPEVRDSGIVPAGVTEAGRKYFGFSGYTEKVLKRKGIEFVVSEIDTTDAYPGAIEGCKPLKIKLYFSKSGKVLGGEIIGSSKYVSPLVDFVSRLIADKLDISQIAALETVAFPPITPPPLLQPIQVAAFAARKEL
jgi:NADPH-dependent 2,4-dienoyl-CoA reductase/sulfur reductase-like enzyme